MSEAAARDRYRALQDLGRRRPEHWEWERAKNPQAFHEWLPKFEAIIDSEGFDNDIDAQVILITFVQTFRALLPRVENTGLKRSRLELRLLSALNADGPWLDYVLGLERVRDIRAALKSRKPRDPIRPASPDEALFPTTGWLGEYLKWVRESQAPPAWHFWSAVTTLGAAARRNLYMGFGDYYLYPNHATVFVGPSASGKSVAFKPPQDLIAEANRLHDLWQYQICMDRSEESIGLDKAPEDFSVVQLASYPTAPYIVKAMEIGTMRPVYNPHTLEPTAVSLLRKQSIGWLANDELKTIIGDQTYAPDQLIALITDFYNCHDTGKGIGTVSRGHDRLRDVCLSFLGASTVEWLTKGVSPAVFEAGFMSRVLYVSRGSEASPFYPGGTPQRDPLILGKLARAMLPWMLIQPIELEPHRSAETLFREINTRCHAQAEKADSKMAPYFKRKFNHIMKLAMVLTMSELLGEHSLDLTAQQIESLGTGIPLFPDNLERACKLVEYEEQFIEPCFASMGRVKESELVDRIVALVRHYNVRLRRPAKMFEMRQAMRHAFGTKKSWQPLLEEALAEGLVKTETLRNKQGKGVPWYWDPRMFTRQSGVDENGVPNFLPTKLYLEGAAATVLTDEFIKDVLDK